MVWCIEVTGFVLLEAYGKCMPMLWAGELFGWIFSQIMFYTTGYDMYVMVTVCQMYSMLLHILQNMIVTPFLSYKCERVRQHLNRMHALVEQHDITNTIKPTKSIFYNIIIEENISGGRVYIRELAAYMEDIWVIYIIVMANGIVEALYCCMENTLIETPLVYKMYLIYRQTGIIFSLLCLVIPVNDSRLVSLLREIDV